MNNKATDSTNGIKQKYVIADLKLLMTTYYHRMYNQALAYASDLSWDEGEADGIIDLGIDFYREKQEQFPQLTLEELEYLYTGSIFHRYLLNFNGCMLHASAVVVDGYAYLFSADSGTGKSTHTQQWLKHFGDKAYIINDDKPVVRYVDGEWFVYGTPWSGKTDQNVNARARLGAIVFLERAADNQISEISVDTAIPLFFRQTVRRFNTEKRMDAALQIMEKILLDTPIYQLKCNISEDAAITAYQKIRRV